MGWARHGKGGARLIQSKPEVGPSRVRVGLGRERGSTLVWWARCGREMGALRREGGGDLVRWAGPGREGEGLGREGGGALARWVGPGR